MRRHPLGMNKYLQRHRVRMGGLACLVVGSSCSMLYGASLSQMDSSAPVQTQTDSRNSIQRHSDSSASVQTQMDSNALVPNSAQSNPTSTLAALLQNKTGFEAEFTQYVTLQAGAEPQKSSGSVAIWRGHVRWQIDTPQAQTYLTDGKTLWQIDNFLQQVTIRPLSHEFSSAPILLLMGDAQTVLSQFEVTMPHPDEYHLVPRPAQSASAGFVSADVQFARGRLISLSFDRGMGETIRIQFSHVLTDPALDDRDFVCVIPKGYDVLDERASPVQ